MRLSQSHQKRSRASEDQTLLIWGNALRVLNLGLDVLDGVRRNNLQIPARELGKGRGGKVTGVQSNYYNYSQIEVKCKILSTT